MLVKKFFLSLVLLNFLFISYLAMAQDFSISLEAHTGFIHGFTQEYVYEKNKQLSRLEWEENAVPIINTTINLTYDHFFMTGTVKTAVPLQSGSMRDYDYLLSNSNALTNFSRHGAWLDRHNIYEINLGYLFQLRSWFISPAAGFSYCNKKWTAKDGYYQYASSGTALQGNELKNYITGSAISYEQKISCFYFNADFGYYLSKKWLITAQFRLAPYIWAESMDHHIMRNTEFYDIMHGGIGGLTGLSATYKPIPSGNLEFVSGFTFEKIFKITGSSSHRATGANANSAYIQSTVVNSGMDNNEWQFFLGIIMMLSN